MGYATGQFGKNHLGDRDEHLPTMHGFDEFFGSLYHLNAEDEPENADYPRNPEFRQRFGPRGVLKSWANPDGTQRIENTGPLTTQAHGDGGRGVPRRRARLHRPRASRRTSPSSPGSTRRACTSGRVPSEPSRGVTGLGVYADGMVEHDGHVGQLLKKLDDLGIAQDTIVIYATDNGAE